MSEDTQHEARLGLRDRVVGTWRHAVDSAKDSVGDLISSVDADLLYDTGADIADTKAPKVDIAQRWDERKFTAKLVNPANRRKLSVIIVGTGLAGASAAATLGEAGYHVTSFCYQDSPRRAHSIAAQGGINAAKNYRNDGDSTYRLFYDTVKGGDFRSRESNVYRLAQVSTNIIDQCVAQGVPFAREYGGLLDNRSFGGVQVSRTFYARGQTGQQLLLGAYQALERQIAAGTVAMHTRHEMLELVVVDGKARGVVVRNMVTGEIETHTADAVVLATGGYGNVFYLSTNAMGCNVTATWRAHRKGAYFGNPCYTQIHPTCIPVSGDYQSKLTLMSESLRNDGRIWVPKSGEDKRDPREIGEDERDYYLERVYPAFGNLVPRDIASRAAKNVCDEGRGVGPGGLGVYLDFADAIERLGRKSVEAKYGNLFDMYAQITGENPYETPMRIYPRRALHDGRPVGRLRPAELDPGTVRDRRGELLRPRRQPARRQRADAGPGRRLLRAAEHDQRLPGRGAVPQGGGVRPGRRRGGRLGAEPDREAALDQGQPYGRLLPQGARPHHVGPLRHGAERGGPAQGHLADP